MEREREFQGGDRRDRERERDMRRKKRIEREM